MTPAAVEKGWLVSGRISDHDAAWGASDQFEEVHAEAFGRYFDAGVDSAHPAAETDAEVETLLVTVSNPGATVSTTVLMNGRMVTVDLAAAVAAWSEARLAEEIVVLATLARKQALAAQHSFAAAFMRQLGHDPAATRGLLERELGLPSPSDVIAEKARIFATRYRDDE